MSSDDLNFDPQNANSALPGEGRGASVGEEWVKTASALADVLGVDRKTINRWQKKDGCPEEDPERGFNVAQWREFGANVGRKTKLPDKADAELAGQLIKNERARLDLEKERGNLLSVDDVADLLGNMAHAFADKLSRSRHDLGPLVAGLPVSEVTKRIGDEHRNVLAELAVPEWAKKKVGAPGRYWSKVSAMVYARLRIENLGDGPRITFASPALP